jgi:hypothetical protein
MTLSIPMRLKTLTGSLASVVVAVAAMAAGVLGASPARAVPAFATQTGQPCQACHVGSFGPQLTAYGRDFKLNGYTARTGGYTVPLSLMAVESFVETQKAQASPPADGFKRNDNLGLDQISIFLAGGIDNHFGGFVQSTYDGIGKTYSWDNVDLRAVTTADIGAHNVLFGVSLNNSPTAQDVWNTLPAWGYPYTGSALAPSPAAAPLLAGGLAQNVIGLTGYAWIDGHIYLELGGYKSVGSAILRRLGGDPYAPGDIDGLAPYARLALQQPMLGGTLEIGAFGLKAHIFPARDRSGGASDHYTDLGLDGAYERTLGNGDMVTLNGRYTHEDQTPTDTCALAGVSSGCADNTLDDVLVDAAYYWRNRIGATVQLFETVGSANPTLYADYRTLKPDSSGVTVQLDATPWGAGGSPLGPRFNVRVGAQYTAYTRFNGSGRNWDGAGANASDNNTVRAFLWVAY